jgi:hypothetical protein
MLTGHLPLERVLKLITATTRKFERNERTVFPLNSAILTLSLSKGNDLAFAVAVGLCFSRWKSRALARRYPSRKIRALAPGPRQQNMHQLRAAPTESRSTEAGAGFSPHTKHRRKAPTALPQAALLAPPRRRSGATNSCSG